MGTTSKQIGLVMILLFGCGNILLAQETPRQKNLWRDFHFNQLAAERKGATLQSNQISAMKKAIDSRTGKNGLCEEGWMDNFTYDEVPLKAHTRVIRVTSGMGCARGGQGANGTMWLFAIQGQRPHFIGLLEGWGTGIQPTMVDGVHDLITGWHMSAAETDLSYYRFTGKVYEKIASASAVSENGAEWRLIRDGSK
jgi:hypothetical protein